MAADTRKKQDAKKQPWQQLQQRQQLLARRRKAVEGKEKAIVDAKAKLEDLQQSIQQNEQELAALRIEVAGLEAEVERARPSEEAEGHLLSVGVGELTAKLRGGLPDEVANSGPVAEAFRALEAAAAAVQLALRAAGPVAAPAPAPPEGRLPRRSAAEPRGDEESRSRCRSRARQEEGGEEDEMDDDEGLSGTSLLLRRRVAGSLSEAASPLLASLPAADS